MIYVNPRAEVIPSQAHPEAYKVKSTSFDRKHAHAHAGTRTTHNELKNQYHIISLSRPQVYSHYAQTSITSVCVVNIVERLCHSAT
jgi:predicted methyltransferase